MPLAVRRCALPLAAALILLGSAGCGDATSTTSRLSDPAVDSSNTRAHRLASLLTRTDTLSTLTRALRQAELLRELRRGGPYTVFAPTDRAFRRHLPGFDSLLAPAGTSRAAPPSGPSDDAAPSPARDSLRRVLRLHLVRGRFAAASFEDSLRLATLAEAPVRLERARGRRRPVRARVRGMSRPAVVRRTLRAQNGVIHLLPRPLRIPPPDTAVQGALGDTTAAPAQ